LVFVTTNTAGTTPTHTYLIRLKPQTWLRDLDDLRVRAEVVKALFADNVVTLFTHVVATALFLWAYDFVRANTWFCVVLVLWCGLAIWSYSAEIKVKRILRAEQLTSEQSWHYLSVNVVSSLLQTCCLSVVLMFFLIHDSHGLNSPAVIGVLFYYFASIIKDFSVRLLSVAYSLILLLPMAGYYFLLGNATSFIIGAFILIFIFGAISFASNMSRVMISQIQQRYTVEALAENLTAERDRADAANAAKSRFFTAASHDARQPLQAIGLLYDSIASSPTMSPEDRRVMEKIGTNLHSIRNLFNRVLDISRIETGSVAPHFQAVPLQNLFNALDAQMGELAASKNLWLRFAATQAVVWHDPDLLERMVGNVIHNALKFTHQGGVWVGYRASRGVLEIRDSGIGVAPHEQQQIFEEFYQLDNTARKRDDGSGLGLGLSIVKRLAALTDTAIGIRSAPSKGTTFWVRLKTSDTRVPSLAQLGTVKTMVEMQNLPLNGCSILLVEDDDELRTLFTERLLEKGIQVTACSSAHRAIENLATFQYDAVLTDYRLGRDGSGVDVAKIARQRLGAALPVIVITGDTSGQGLKEMAEQPHTWVLHKPVSIDQLLAIFPKGESRVMRHEAAHISPVTALAG
jgi:two-component system, sensor histidine kinase